MKAVWLLLLCLGAWAAVSFAGSVVEEDGDLAEGLKEAIDEKVKTALGEATAEEAEEVEEAADLDSESDEEEAEEVETEEADEETDTTSRRKRTPLFKRAFAVCLLYYFLITIYLYFDSQNNFANEYTKKILGTICSYGLSGV